ncbi:MAG: hypothetical protein DRP75_03810 [Candidatus Omnitrophota bacterium]|nr:MAG: hypothetical protein DRP75_03810 [Candidatus Omnitrophota bacterium]
MSAINNNDKVGLIIFSDKIEKYIAPKKGRRNVLRMIREVLYFQPEHKGTSIKTALEYLGRVVKKRAVVFLISDFIDTDFRSSLAIISRKHDLIGIKITDKREQEFPNVGFLELEDAESGERMIIDSRDEGFRKRFALASKRREESLRMMFRSLGIDLVEIFTHKSYERPLIDFFTRRARRIRC